MQNFHTQEHLITFTGLTLASGLQHENFQNISATRGNLRGYMTAIHFVVTGSVDESTAAADLPKEVLWNILSLFTIKGHLHEWCSSLPGWIVVVCETQDETINTENSDDVPIADITSTETPTPFVMSYFLPMAPKHFQPHSLGKGELDGMFPLAAMGSRGEIDFTVASALVGNWELSAGTTLTVKIYVHEFWTEKVIVPAPWRIRSITDTKSDVDLPGPFGTIDMMFMTDHLATVATTLPTGQVRLKVQGTTIYDDLTGIALEWLCNRSGRIDAVDDIVDNGLVPLRWPQQSQSMFDCPTGDKVLVAECGVAHVAAAGTPRYTTRRYIPADAEQLVEWPKLMGRAFDPDTERSLMTVANKRPGVNGVPVDPVKIAGANMRIPAKAVG